MLLKPHYIKRVLARFPGLFSAWIGESIFILVGAVFLAELCIMALLATLPYLNPTAKSLIDAFFISVLTLPILLQLKLRKRALHNQVQRMHVILNSIGDALVIANRNGQITYINPHAENLTGWNTAEAQGQRLGDVFRVTHEHTLESGFPGDFKSIAEFIGGSNVSDFVLESKDGQRYYIEYSGTSIDDNDELDMVLVFRDVSEKRRILHEQQALFERLNCLIEALPDSIFFKDGNGCWLTVNSAGQKLFRLEGIDWQGKNEAELSVLQPELAEVHQACLESDENAWGQGKVSLNVERFQEANGDVRYFDVTKVPLFTPSGQRRALVIIGRDITDKLKAEEELKLLASVFRNNRQEGIMITTAGDDPRIIRVNQAFTEITGYLETEVKGLNPRILKSGHHDQEFYREMHKCLSEQGMWSGEIWTRRKNGEIYPEWLNICNVKGPDQRPTHYIATLMDLSQRKEYETRIHQLAYYDALTGLPNRTLLEDRVRNGIANAERSSQHIAFLFIDLDDFKTVNDSLGHVMGDELLKGAASRLLQCVRESDTLARLGGDEFVVMLPGFQDSNHASAAASTVAEKICTELNQPFWLEGNEIVVTPSIGITLFPTDASDYQNMVKHADTAMYAAKAAGRNTYRFFATSMDKAAKRRMAVESQLRHALERNELTLHYQPQVIKNGNVVGAEALLRWQNETLGAISPMEFIPLAEETGSIISIGDWVIHSVCDQINQWSAEGVFENIEYIAINISAKQFQQADFVNRLHAIVQQAGISPASLELEITEGSLMHDISEVKARLHELKALGYRVSVDDFGTGYSSLAYLKHFPIDVLKIDRSFVRDIGIDTDDEAISRTIIHLAENLGLKTIAEGVENKTQLAYLDTHGCDVYQGYLFGKPMTAGELTKLISSGNEF